MESSIDSSYIQEVAHDWTKVLRLCKVVQITKQEVILAEVFIFSGVSSYFRLSAFKSSTIISSRRFPFGAWCCCHNSKMPQLFRRQHQYPMIQCKVDCVALLCTQRALRAQTLLPRYGRVWPTMWDVTSCISICTPIILLRWLHARTAERILRPTKATTTTTCVTFHLVVDLLVRNQIGSLYKGSGPLKLKR
jgi:hypothetical protein